MDCFVITDKGIINNIYISQYAPIENNIMYAQCDYTQGNPSVRVYMRLEYHRGWSETSNLTFTAVRDTIVTCLIQNTVERSTMKVNLTVASAHYQLT